MPTPNALRKLRTRLSEAQNHRCCYCGIVMIFGNGNENARNACTIEHVQPICRGGLTTWDNCVAACKRCNNRRGSSDAISYRHDRPKPKIYAPRSDLRFATFADLFKQAMRK